MTSPLASPRRAARVLVVEDDAAIREAYCDLLSFEGFEVETANDGREALEQLRRSASPDLILLDMMMPHLDGTAVLRALRTEPAWARLKVIVVSATEIEAPAGVVGFVKKPFDPGALVRMIRAQLPAAS